jgi:hypothetical protein
MGNLGEKRLETGYLDGQTDPVLVKNGKAQNGRSECGTEQTWHQLQLDMRDSRIAAIGSGDKLCKLKAFKVGLSAFVLA